MKLPEPMLMLWHAGKHLHRHGRFCSRAADIAAIQIISEKYKQISVELFGYVVVPEECFQQLRTAKWV